jgi:light-regulated signal transduction histidine kinase (bacteriophytochrome)
MQDMTTNVPSEPSPAQRPADDSAQSCGFVLELSPDWLIMRASENAHGFLGEYPARLIGEPLSSFTLAQPLHDLRNSLSRQRSSNGIARAYRTRLTTEPRHFDIAFQQVDGRLLLEGLPSGTDGFGDSLGAVSRLVDGMVGDTRSALLDNAARRMRALTGFDRVTIMLTGEDGRTVESSRSKFASPAVLQTMPALVADATAQAVGVYPANRSDSAIGRTLLRGLSDEERAEVEANGVRSALTVPLARQGHQMGWVRCESRTPRTPSLELHAAAELFAQIVAIELERIGD